MPTGARVETYANPTYLPRIPEHLNVDQMVFTEEAISKLPERSPDYLILIRPLYNGKKGSRRDKLVTFLLQEDSGYRPIRTFRTKPLLAPNLIPGLSPEILILQKHDGFAVLGSSLKPDQ
jgi:hypothetical protein